MEKKEVECKIKEEIRKFKEINGNVRFSQTELIMYLVQKIDRIEERYISWERDFGELDGKVSLLVKFMVVSAPLLAGILGFLFSRL